MNKHMTGVRTNMSCETFRDFFRRIKAMFYCRGKIKQSVPQTTKHFRNIFLYEYKDVFQYKILDGFAQVTLNVVLGAYEC